MVDILHRVGVRAPVSKVYKAVTAVEPLAGWWTEDTTGKAGAVGDTVAFRFGEAGGFDMAVRELKPDERVLWEVVDGPAEWIGTHVVWELKQAGDFAIILFKHEGWKEPVEFMHHCSTRWATFLMSLKALVETGNGEPYPNAVEVSDWM